MSRHTFGRPVEILLVEDNPGDVRLTQEALREADISNHLHVAEDGFKAIDYLKKQGNFTNAKRPDLVLLDLNIPGMNGKSVLEKIKNDKNLKTIPVLILSSSDAQEDINMTYENHANCYIQKPSDLDNFVRIFKGIEIFWTTIAKLPEQ